MDGLECSELQYSEVKKENKLLRFDAEYFDKKALNYIRKIKTLNSAKVEDEFDVTKLAGFEFTEYFTNQNLSSNNNYIALTSKNVQVNRIALDEYITIDKTIADTFLTRSKLNIKDVVLSYTGEYRRACVIFNDGYQLGPNVCKFSQIGKRINSEMLSFFFNSCVGQKILDREKTLSAQPTVAMQRLRTIDIPIFTNLQKELKHVYYSANQLLIDAKKLYADAENILNDYLQIDYSKLDNSNYSIKTLKNSYNATDRLDAEYYQVRYDELVDKLNNLRAVKLGRSDGICKFVKSIEPGSEYYGDVGVPFIRVSNISKYGIAKSEIKIPLNIVDNIEKLYPKKDTILFSKDGSIGIAYKLEEDLKIITSSALLHLYINDKKCMLPDYLTLVLNSNIVKMQADRDSNGAIIQHWRMDEISNVLIPVAPIDIQKQISDKIKTSFEMRKKSQELISIGIRAVEIAIEKSEKDAISYIRDTNLCK